MNVETRRIVREELLRSIAWVGLGLVGWAVLISEFAWLEASALTALGLPFLTWAFLTGGMIGVRLATAGEFQVQSEVGIILSVIIGIILGGVAAIYLVTQGHSALLVGSLYVAAAAATALWSWFVVLPDFEPNGAV